MLDEYYSDVTRLVDPSNCDECHHGWRIDTSIDATSNVSDVRSGGRTCVRPFPASLFPLNAPNSLAALPSQPLLLHQLNMAVRTHVAVPVSRCKTSDAVGWSLSHLDVTCCIFLYCVSSGLSQRLLCLNFAPRGANLSITVNQHKLI